MGLPRKPLYILLFILFSDSFAATGLFSYVTFMVKDFGVEEQDVGYYSGYLASVFYLSQFLTCFWWGSLSDKYGRKPFLLLGVLGTLTANLCLGVSVRFWQALLARAVGGLFNSNLPIAKSFLADICDKKNRADAMSKTTLMFGVGQLVGPFYSGLVSQLAVKMPSVFGDTFIAHYPYLIPCFTSVLLSCVAFVVAFFHLPETNNRSFHTAVQPSHNHALMASDSEGEELSSTVTRHSDHPHQQRSDSDEPVVEFHRSSSLGPHTSASPQDEADDPLSDEQVIDVQQVKHLIDKSFSREEEEEEEAAAGTSVGRKQLALQLPLQIAAGLGEGGKGDSVFPPEVIKAIVMFSCGAVTNIGFAELYPAWAMLPRDNHGLAFTTSDIGFTWGVAGLALILIQGFLFARLANKLGSIRLLQLGWLPASIIILFPLISYIQSTPLMWTVVCLFFVLRSAGIAFIMASLNLFINLASPPQHVGKTNGMNSTVAALCRGIGPFVLTSIFAWSLQNGLSFPFDWYFGFLIVQCILTIVLITSFFVPNLGKIEESKAET